MSSDVRFHPNAVEDIQKAIEYYDTVSPEVARRFRAECRERLESIKGSPKVYPFAPNSLLRFARFKKFPYMYLYDAQTSAPIISRLVHTGSDPESW